MFWEPKKKTVYLFDEELIHGVIMHQCFVASVLYEIGRVDGNSSGDYSKEDRSAILISPFILLIEKRAAVYRLGSCDQSVEILENKFNVKLILKVNKCWRSLNRALERSGVNFIFT